MFEELYKKYFHDIFLYSKSLCREDNLAEELTQETFFIAGWFLGQFYFIPVILGIIAIIIAVKKKDTHLVKLPAFLSVVAIIMGIFDFLLFHTDLFFSF